MTQLDTGDDMIGLHLICPHHPERRIFLPYDGSVPPPKGRKLANTTILVRDDIRPDVIWKLTPWEKAESVFAEMDVYAGLIQTEAPGIVPLLGVSGTSDHLARAYEYAPFGELSHFLRSRQRQPKSVGSKVTRGLLAQIAAAMQGLHARGLVHRDLKAENVLVFDDGAVPTVKLADFDRAIELAAGEMLTSPVGSLFHMAPELHAGQPYDRRVDIYAFGILIFEVAHGGARLFPQVASGLPGAICADTFIERIIHQGMRPEWRHGDLVLHDLAVRCLSPDPANRPEFDEIAAVLAEYDSPCLAVPHAPQIPIARPVLPDAVGMAATIGKKRAGMEDALCMLETGQTRIMAVFDGLRGSRVSAFAARSVLPILARRLDAQDDVATAIRFACDQVQAKIRRLDPVVQAGSTATIAVIRQGMLHLGWIGDSPAWLMGDNGICELVTPHHPGHPSEDARIAEQGGSVRRETRMMDSGEEIPWGPLRCYGPDGAGGIALTRALGLPALGPVISNAPTLISRPLAPSDRFLVLATDGVSEVVRPQDLHDILTEKDHARAAAKAVIDQVLQNGAPDNASVIILKLR